jgi:acyl-CoA synthetase (NDP forming)
MEHPLFPNLTRLFAPRTIALLGASTEASKIGGRPLAYSLKHGNKAKVYAVNPKARGGQILGFPCFASIEDIPEAIDLAIIALPARMVVESIKQCVKKKVPFGIVFSSGFGELGEEGKRLEQEMVETARRGGMRLIGPNCQGVINLQENIIASFTPALAIDKITPGHIGLVSQSGAFAGSIFNFAQQRRIGLSRWVSIGNQADLDVWDCFADMITDEQTRVMGGYVEGIKDGAKMMEVAERALEAGKPIILLKGGISERGAKAALSHTGSIAGSATVAKAAFFQRGIVRVDGIEELFDIATVFADVQKPAKDGIGILTTSGAAGVLITDRCEQYGLHLAPLTEDTKKRMASALPDFGSVANPVDMTAQMINEPEIFSRSLDIFLEDETVGTVIIMFTMVTEELADICAAKLADAVPKSNKAVVLCWMATKLADPQIEIVRQKNIPVFETPYRCVRVVNALVKYHEFLNNWKKQEERRQAVFYQEQRKDTENHISTILTTAQKKAEDRNGRQVVTELDTRPLLRAYGIQTPKAGLASSDEEALAIASEVGYPVVIKIESPDILHRSDAGAIHLGIKTPEELRKAYDQVVANARRYNPKARLKGVSVQEMIQGDGVECIVGTQRDADFGWTIVFGLGGIFVEILRDVSLRVTPLRRSDAEAMIEEIKGYQVLKGARVRKESDIPAIVNVLLQVSRLLEDYGDHLMEFEINPLIVLPSGQGAYAADCLMILK